MNSALHARSLVEIARAIRAQEVTAEEVTEAMLGRIDELNGHLAAYVVVDRGGALKSARAADDALARGEASGRLHGVPVAVKDVFDLGRTRAGSRALADNRPARPAAQVRALTAAGAVVLGKLTTWEFALAFATTSDPTRPARNPWDPARSPSGSSSGAGTALAAGLAFGAIGTDTGGSVRLPAGACGVVGLKPTFGLLSTEGVVPLSPTLDHVGPMARTVGDVSLMLDALRPMSPRGGATPGQGRESLDGVRVGVPRALFQEGCELGVLAAFNDAVEGMAGAGADVVDIALDVKYGEATAIAYLILLSEASAHHRRHLQEQPELLGPEFRQLLRAGLLVSAPGYVDALRARTVIADAVDAALRSCDVLALPTAGAPPGPLLERPAPLSVRLRRDPLPSFTWLMNLHGGPAISVPCGLCDGLPVGLQLCGARGADDEVLGIAHAYEQTRVWDLPKGFC